LKNIDPRYFFEVDPGRPSKRQGPAAVNGPVAFVRAAASMVGSQTGEPGGIGGWDDGRLSL
jgi:hypothetical protein